MDTLVEMQGICKSFGPVSVLRDVSFCLKAGEIHALMGENGAGKSTLMKVLTGIYPSDAGEIRVQGRSVDIRGPKHAEMLGIAIIHQELNLIPELSVADNMFLGRELTIGRTGILRHREMRRRTREYLARLNVLDIDPDCEAGSLSIGQQQMVEIARALSLDARVLIMDEPTAALTEREIEALFRLIRELRAAGVGIVYVSHRMEEIFALSDAITVFKDGRYVRTFTDMAQVNHDQLVQAMVGRELGDIYHWQPRQYGPERLRLDSVKAPGVRTPISLSVRSGEIVGLFGLVGAGRSELMKGLFGGTRITDGQVSIDGERVDIQKPAHAIGAGMMLCPEDRKAEGIIPVHSVRDNINISARRKFIRAGCLINDSWESSNADHHIRSLNIKTPGPEQLIMNLSGGNQQKAILGRWLSEDMKVILLDEPTRGIDVGAKHEIYNVIYELAKRGVAVLFASSDLPEVLGVADRIVVMREGEIAGELLHEQANEQQALNLAMPKVSQAVA